jgi:hypothetical protein
LFSAKNSAGDSTNFKKKKSVKLFEMKREIAMQRERLCLRTVSFGLRGVLDLDLLDSIGLSVAGIVIF